MRSMRWACKLADSFLWGTRADSYRTAYDLDQPFSDLLNTATVLPIFDGGNVGIRRRHMQDLMLSPTYDAWASTFGPSK